MRLGDPLLTDLYELTMMQGYFKNSSRNKTVVFDLFYRNNPWDNGFAVMAGVEQVLTYIDNLKFTQEDIAYLKSQKIFEEDFLNYLSNFKFSGNIYAVPEGRVVFPREPIIKVIAPIMEAQLIETAILNLINHQCLIATKACRVVQAAKNDMVMEFGLRRAQGPDAGVYGARASIIGGCCGTSNVLAGAMFDVPIMGTHAHSWIMSFSSEIEAFRAYGKLYPNKAIFLVDTYNTLKSGVPNAIKVFHEMKKEGTLSTGYGIRLDSGDLAYLSKKARAMLNAAGLYDAVICASNDLDEFLIESLKNQDAKITLWGVGTNLITAAGNPSFGGVYKMSGIQGDDGEFIPKIKLSDNAVKVTDPGNKKIYRIYEEPTHKIKADYICLDEENLDASKDLSLFSPSEPWKKTQLRSGEYSIEELLVPMYDNGKRVYPTRKVMDIQQSLKNELNNLWDESKRLINPHSMYVDLSEKLYSLKNRLFTESRQ